jgi:hypothetical protein
MGMENNWVQTIPGKVWFMILRSLNPGSLLASGRDRTPAVMGWHASATCPSWIR